MENSQTHLNFGKGLLTKSIQHEKYLSYVLSYVYQR